ncbi:TAP-like protein [Actinomadura pelletieri DSM 43383]|uniref:TAP-like protein n=1 Tax=Actinomadura pelletieri DSM 43383 TaxID=1120940 RepID=A0A495QA15_9ACTN|nr:alpha/beta hydrolase [Actinomadura pelletieri]RKS68181.1 TAP-like protein [Actinomadura pelletieri DSM 43383]
MTFELSTSTTPMLTNSTRGLGPDAGFCGGCSWLSGAGARAWTGVSLDIGNACIRWPDRHGPIEPTGGPFPDVPVLVVSGDLDTNTPTEDGRLAARQFRRATVVEVPNVGHVPEKEPSGRVAGIESAFVRNLRVGDTSCLADIPPVPVQSEKRS